MADQIKELEAQLKAAKDAAQADMKAEAAAIYAARTYVWTVDWTTGRWRGKPSQYCFSASRMLSPESIAAMQDWEARVATQFDSWNAPTKPWYGKLDSTESMTYVLIGNLMTHSGGGTMLLKGSDDAGDAFSPEPRLLTDIEVQSLKNGVVPETLKR